MTCTRRRRCAFTLMEILVVMLILVLLMAIAIPAFVTIRRSAKRTATEMDMQSIRTALEAYKHDHGYYPGQGPQSSGVGINTGFALLGRELLGIYGDGYTGNPPMPDPDDPPTWSGSTAYQIGDCVHQQGSGTFVALADNTGQATTITQYWAGFDPHDGRDGPGGKLGTNGKNVGPYIQPERMKHRGCALLDRSSVGSGNFSNDEKPILYFPSHNSNVNINKMIGQNASFVWPGPSQAKFDANENIQFFIRGDDTAPLNANAVHRIQGMLGDMNFNGIIDSPAESTERNAAYILWAPGPDGFYGPKTRDSNQTPTVKPTDVSKCDDIIVTP